jgi:hypothetical protein
MSLAPDAEALIHGHAIWRVPQPAMPRVTPENII